MITEVRFNRNTTYQGRNGLGILKGVEVESQQDDANITLYAINSRAGTAACYLDIPKEDVPELIKLLQLSIK